MNNSISSPKITRLILSHNIFIFGRSIFDLFFSLFIWNTTDSLPILASFLLTRIATHMIGFSIFAPLAKRGKPYVSRTISLLGLAISYLIILILADSIINHIILVATAVGFFNGIYWISYLVMQFDLTNIENRGNYNGTNIAAKTAALILGPLVGGVAIQLNLFNLGYNIIFILGAISYTTSLFVGYIKFKPITNDSFHIVNSLKKISRNKDIVKLMIGRFFGNFGYKGALERLLPIFLFETLQSEIQTGGLISLFSVTAIVTTFIIGKYTKRSKYSQIVTLGGSLFFISTLSLIGVPSIITYIIYGFSREILLPLLEIPVKVHRDNLLHLIPEHKKHRVEYIVIREWIYVFGSRSLGYGLLFFVDDLSGNTLQIILALMAFSILIETLIVRNIRYKNPTTEEQEPELSKI